MDPNNNPFNIQNSSNYPFYYPNPNNYQIPNHAPNQQIPQNMSNFGFAPNFMMPSAVPNYPPYYGAMIPYPTQAPPPYSSTPTDNPNEGNVEGNEFPGFSTQMSLEGTPNPEGATPSRRKNFRWTTAQNLVLLSGWIKYGTNSVVGRSQKADAYWGKITDYCNEHCKFDTPRDATACRNHYNYMSKLLSKWMGAYDHAKRMQKSGWSESDVMAKAQELYAGDKGLPFNLLSEWMAVRDQPRFESQVGGNTGSGSSGSKRSHDSSASDSNSVGSSARPMGRDAAKKKAKRKGKNVTLEAINENWESFRQLKEKELERLGQIATNQEEAILEMKKKTESKNMKLWMKLSSKENLDARGKELLERLNRELFGN